MVRLHDKDFVPFIDEKALQNRIAQLGNRISEDFKGTSPLLIGVLNGSFMFLSDLSKHIHIPTEISFIKVSSYASTTSTGAVTELIGLQEQIKDRHVIIVEDIVDTGLSMKVLLEKLNEQKPSKIAIVSLLLKPEALVHPINVDYIGFEIPNKFVVGYGLDYNGLGRNLPEIYQLK
jgi:hypoxanthine phosphoribosyltransferase